MCMASPKGLFYREFGKNLAQSRQRASFTQEALAKAAGLSRTSIVNIEKGRQTVTLDLAVRLASHLGSKLADLLPEPDATETLKDVASELLKVSPDARPWVERVITSSALRKDSEHETAIHNGKAKSL